MNEGAERDPGLKIVEKQYYKLYDVDRECTVHQFVIENDIALMGNRDLGYFFYEFTEPELMPHINQVILMDKVITIMFQLASILVRDYL